MNQAKQVPVTLIEGDGIGPEITAALVAVFESLGQPVGWRPASMGAKAFEQSGEALPSETVASLRYTGLAIKGPIQTPLAVGFRSPLVRLRQEFQLFVNLRPNRTLLTGSGRPPLDIVVVRENTEGLYAASEAYIAVGDDPRAVAVATAYNTRAGCERILRFAFEHAVKHGRNKVTVVHKANVLKILSGIFLETARDLYQTHYSGCFELEEMIVDACAMRLAMTPEHFDVIVTTNLFGDILSDLAAGVTGGLGMAPGANIGEGLALFEPVHGSAPDIAGHGVANPSALLLAGAMLLDHIGKASAAARLRAAIVATLNDDRVRTSDLGGTASCAEFTATVRCRLQDDSL
ncbi:MAG: isocitrate/isopropylmalate family dehydrogenase [Betaproteobacteria bacterium]|nr:isocitrate/isopropylmalate family dehydrogenase [Betaproteobacteria bacterium]